MYEQKHVGTYFPDGFRNRQARLVTKYYLLNGTMRMYS